jgi:ABC-type glycerol-3-phosphate transport system permease component
LAWLVLILLIAAAVVEIARNRQEISGHGVARAVIGELVHVLIGFGLALALHWLLARAAMWIAIAVAAIATYVAATHLDVHGGFRAAHVWTGIPFGLLLGAAAVDAIPRAVREAAMIDRATGWFAFRTITLPLAAPLLLAGAVFLAAAALAPVMLWPFIAAHALLIAAVALDAVLARGRR